jgi:hypothetical protein
MLYSPEHELFVVGMLYLFHFDHPLLVEDLYGVETQIMFASHYCKKK